MKNLIPILQRLPPVNRSLIFLSKFHTKVMFFCYIYIQTHTPCLSLSLFLYHTQVRTTISLLFHVWSICWTYRKILKLLVQLLAKIAANPATKMNTMNLSIVLAPNIIKYTIELLSDDFESNFE